MTDNKLPIPGINTNITLGPHTLGKIMDAVPAVICEVAGGFPHCRNRMEYNKLRKEAQKKSFRDLDKLTPQEHFLISDGGTFEGYFKNLNKLETLHKTTEQQNVNDEKTLEAFAEKLDEGTKQDPDFFFNTWEQASKYSDKDMQDLYARVLSQKMDDPKSLNLSVIDILGRISPEQLEKFRILAHTDVENAFFLDSNNIESYSYLKHHNIGILDIKFLESLGIIVLGLESLISFDALTLRDGTLLKCSNMLNKISVIPLTPVGKQLFKIVDLDFESVQFHLYIDDWVKYLESKEAGKVTVTKI